MKALLKKYPFLIAFSVALPISQAWSTDVTIGGQVGSLSAVEGPTDTRIGYGAFVQGSALDVLTLQADFFTAKINGYNATGIAPSLMWHLIKFDELRFGLLAGPGFYKVASDPWRFGVQGGAFGEVSFIPNLPIGMQARYHCVMGGKDNDLWSIFMTIGYRFNAGGGDGW
jgi:hypothetical protein